MTTIKDVAKKAGVSITTVSFVLNNTNNKISDETRNKVLKAAVELDYSPNIMARALAGKKSNSVMLLIPEISNPFFAKLAQFLSIEMEKYDLRLFLKHINGKIGYKDLLNIIHRNLIDLTIIVNRKVFPDDDRIFKKSKFIFLDEILDDKCYSVTGNNEYGGFLVADYLLKNGYKKTALLTGKKDSYNSGMRLQGFKKRLEKDNIKLPANQIFEGDYSFEKAYELSAEILKGDFDSLFCFNDLSAYGFYHYAKKTGVKVGEDISVIGYDDLMFNEMIYPNLTSVSQNLSEIARKAAELTDNLLSEKETKVRKILVEPTLVIRDSVKEIK